MKLNVDPRSKLVLTEDPKTGDASLEWTEKGTGRACGSCQLCCRLLPVPTVPTAAGERCKHAKYGKGCGLKDNRPSACIEWSCRWLCDRKTAGLARPDRSHYVVDLVPDYITGVKGDGTKFQITALQVWVDPNFPDAHRDPALRAYLAEQGELFRCVAVIRFDSSIGMVLIPPALNGGEWAERWDGLSVRENDPRRHLTWPALPSPVQPVSAEP